MRKWVKELALVVLARSEKWLVMNSKCYQRLDLSSRYIRPKFFSPLDRHVTYRAGRNVGLKPYVVCRLQSVNGASRSHKANLKSTKVSVRRLYRPDDISSDKALLFIYQRSLALCLMFTTFFMCIITIILCLWFHVTLCFLHLDFNLVFFVVLSKYTTMKI